MGQTGFKIDNGQREEIAEKIGAAAAHAVRCGDASFNNLVRQLWYLGRFDLPCDHSAEVRTYLRLDGAPHSFGFGYQIRRYDVKACTCHPKREGRCRYCETWDAGNNWHTQIVGGLIYDGPEAPNDGSYPALTVSIGGPDYPHWSTHT